MISSQPLALLLYLGGLELLLREWAYFHNLIRVEPRESLDLVFDGLFAVWSAQTTPGPATALWQDATSTLQRWRDQYQGAGPIGDFTPDQTSVTCGYFSPADDAVTLIQLNTADQYRGRVASTLGTTTSVMALLGIFISSALGDRLGAVGCWMALVVSMRWLAWWPWRCCVM